MQSFDILVIGGGMAGASAAYFLAQQLGAKGRIGLVEAESQPGYHASGRSAAVLIPTYGGPKVEPLTRASWRYLEEQGETVFGKRVLSPRGMITLARADQISAMQTHAKTQAESGVTEERLSAEEATRRVPILQPDYVAEAMFDPACFDLDVAAMHQGFLRGFKAAGGAVVMDFRVEQLEKRGAAWRVRSATDEMQADVIVNAAGAWGDEIAKSADIASLGLQALRRTIIVTPADSPVPADMPIVVDVDEEFYFRGEGTGLLASPGDETASPPCDAQPEEEDVATIAWRLQQATTLPVRSITNKWAGLRTFSQDRVPALGWDGSAQGFFWCVGQGGFGIQTAPAIAALVASMVAGENIPEWLEDKGIQADLYDPTRFQGADA